MVTMDDIRVSFSNFWPSFDIQENLFKSILEEFLGLKVRVVDKNELSDLEFTSVFHMKSTFERGSKYLYSKVSRKAEIEYENAARYGFVSREKSRSKKRIWYSGENFRTPYGCADGYIGFDKNDSIKHVVYFPHWMYRLYSQKNALKGSSIFQFNYLMSPRDEEYKNNRVCIFSSSLDPRRKMMIEIIKEYFEVETFGKAFGKYVDSKSEVSRKFGFQICPENALYPGYVTEKIIESWNCGNIPIWEGLDSEGYFNKEAFIDLTGANTKEIHEVIDQISKMNHAEIRSQPILRRVPDISPVVDVIKSLLA
jgi:hypothetical protein